MRLPQSRLTRHRGGHGSRLFTLIAIALVAALIGAGLFLVVRARSPILPIAETTRSMDAIELWRTGDYRRVVDVTSAHLQRYPLDETSLTLRGFSSFYLALEAVDSEKKQDLLIKAVQDLRRVLLKPEPAMEAQIRYTLGKSYYHRGQFFFDLAVRELEKARDLGMMQLDLLEYLALAHASLGNTDTTIDYFRAALDLGDEDVHRLSLADVLIDESRYDDADALLYTVLDSSTDVILRQHGLLSLGESRRGQGRYEAALEAFQELLELNPSSAEARFQLGETFLEQGENDRARFEWREALRLNPNHIESFQRLQEY